MTQFYAIFIERYYPNSFMFIIAKPKEVIVFWNDELIYKLGNRFTFLNDNDIRIQGNYISPFFPKCHITIPRDNFQTFILGI